MNREEKVLFVKSEGQSGWTAIGPFWFRCTEAPTLKTEMAGVIPNVVTLIKIKTVFEYWLTKNNVAYAELTSEILT